jgi:hypothetical protein
VTTKPLNEQIRRNRERFPEDFMFQLTAGEFTDLKSQIVISSWGGLRRATPYAFTEQGVAMLSSVLRSKRAVQVDFRLYALCPMLSARPKASVGRQGRSASR